MRSMRCALCGDGTTEGCVERLLVYNDGAESTGRTRRREPIPYGDEPMYDDWIPSTYCAQCGVAVGDYHHVGCELEICPRCGDQLGECDCQPGMTARDDAPL